MKAQGYLEGRDDDDNRTYTKCDPDQATHVAFSPPGPVDYYILPLKGKAKGWRDNWTWNGDTEKPTIRASVLNRFGDGLVNHFFVTDGRVEFLTDCTHDLKGQTVDLLDFTR